MFIMFANDGILSKSPVLILIRVCRQRSAWHCTDARFPTKCKSEKFGRMRRCLRLLASSKGSMEFVK